jgi:predicted type IV restriction endonuclease
LSILDDLKTAATGALSAGSATARAQGTALEGDFETLVKPNLDAIVARIASIARDRIAGDIGDDQARDDLDTQFDNVQPIILAETDLALLAVQSIINAVLAALKAGVNAATTQAIGIALV